MQLRSLFLILSFLTLPACVTTHTGAVSSFESIGLRVSCSNRPDIDELGYHAIQCNFENVVRAPQRFEVSSVAFEDRTVEVVDRFETQQLVGDWQAHSSEDRFERKARTLGFMGVGVLMVIFGNADVADFGSSIVSAASAYDVSEDIAADYNGVQYGSSRIFSQPFVGSRNLAGGFRTIKRGFLVRSASDLSRMRLCIDSELDEVCAWVTLDH